MFREKIHALIGNIMNTKKEEKKDESKEDKGFKIAMKTHEVSTTDNVITTSTTNTKSTDIRSDNVVKEDKKEEKIFTNAITATDRVLNPRDVRRREREKPAKSTNEKLYKELMSEYEKWKNNIYKSMKYEDAVLHIDKNSKVMLALVDDDKLVFDVHKKGNLSIWINDKPLKLSDIYVVGGMHGSLYYSDVLDVSQLAHGKLRWSIDGEQGEYQI